MLGEFAAGIVLDAIIKRARHQFAGANPPPEIRLKAIWTGAILVPAGLLIYGFTLAYQVFWFAPIFCYGARLLWPASYRYHLLYIASTRTEQSLPRHPSFST